MPVAHFTSCDHAGTVTRTFDAPKRASIRAWYNAATAHMKGVAPKYEPRFEAWVDVTEDTIIFNAPRWALFIARKRHLGM